MSEEQVVPDAVHVEATETVDSGETTIIGDPAPTPDQQVASKADVDAVLDAVIELTKVVAENTKESSKWFRAGKMGGV